MIALLLVWMGSSWAGPPARLIANETAGFVLPVDLRQIQGILRGMIQETPSGRRSLVYLPGPHNPATLATFQLLLKWSEFTFAQKLPVMESVAGRPLFKNLNSEAEVLTAVGTDPGGIGIISGDLLLSGQVVVLWEGGP